MRSHFLQQVTTSTLCEKTSHGGHTLSVNTADFTDERDVRRVKKRLREMGVLVGDSKVVYMPDIYTQIPVYHKHQWCLRPVFFVSSGLDYLHHADAVLLTRLSNSICYPTTEDVQPESVG